MQEGVGPAFLGCCLKNTIILDANLAYFHRVCVSNHDLRSCGFYHCATHSRLCTGCVVCVEQAMDAGQLVLFSFIDSSHVSIKTAESNLNIHLVSRFNGFQFKLCERCYSETLI